MWHTGVTPDTPHFIIPSYHTQRTATEVVHLVTGPVCVYSGYLICRELYVIKLVIYPAASSVTFLSVQRVH